MNVFSHTFVITDLHLLDKGVKTALRESETVDDLLTLIDECCWYNIARNDAPKKAFKIHFKSIRTTYIDNLFEYVISNLVSRYERGIRYKRILKICNDAWTWEGSVIAKEAMSKYKLDLDIIIVEINKLLSKRFPGNMSRQDVAEMWNNLNDIRIAYDRETGVDGDNHLGSLIQI